MNIALIAHDAKKELMVQFCIAYCGVLSRHNLCATGTTGKMVAEATGLRIQRFLIFPGVDEQHCLWIIKGKEVSVSFVPVLFPYEIGRAASFHFLCKASGAAIPACIIKMY